MKLSKLLITGILFLFFSGVVFGQNLTYSAAESLLNDDQRDRLEDAEKYFGKADVKIKSAKAIEDKNKKSKKEKKKKKKKKDKKEKTSKYDKKIWEAKKFRIQAEKDYLKAYEKAYEVYSEIITKADYYDEGDISEANSLNNGAKSLLEEAAEDMKTYDRMGADKKALKNLSSSKLNSAISGANRKKENAYDKQKEALDLVLAQGRKKEENERDDKAWANAQSIHTIASYQDYLDDFPSGKYVTNARQMINQLRKEEEERNKQTVSNYTFMIQIATSGSTLSNWELKNRYSNTSEIKKEYIDGMYKYRIDKAFTSYEEAYNFANSIKNKNRDLFIVAYSKSGNQVQITEDMKPDHLKGKTPTMY